MGEIPYQKADDARGLAQGYKSRILVSVRMFMTMPLFTAVRVSFRVHSKKIMIQRHSDFHY